jgi:hypothetical protein
MFGNYLKLIGRLSPAWTTVKVHCELHTHTCNSCNLGSSSRVHVCTCQTTLLQRSQCFVTVENRTSVSPCVCACVCARHLWLATPGIWFWWWEREIALIIASANAESIQQSEEILLTKCVHNGYCAFPCRCNCSPEASLSTWLQIIMRIIYIYIPTIFNTSATQADGN